MESIQDVTIGAYNWDWGSATAPEAVQTCGEKGKAVMSDTYMIPSP
jgi:hypothetical protein